MPTDAPCTHVRVRVRWARQRADILCVAWCCTGLEVDPNHSTIKANLAGLAAAPTRTAAPAAAAGTLVQFLTANPVTTAQAAARLFMVAMAVRYPLPV